MTAMPPAVSASSISSQSEVLNPISYVDAPLHSSRRLLQQTRSFDLTFEGCMAGQEDEETMNPPPDVLNQMRASYRSKICDDPSPVCKTCCPEHNRMSECPAPKWVQALPRYTQ